MLRLSKTPPHYSLLRETLRVGKYYVNICFDTNVDIIMNCSLILHVESFIPKKLKSVSFLIHPLSSFENQLRSMHFTFLFFLFIIPFHPRSPSLQHNISVSLPLSCFLSPLSQSILCFKCFFIFSRCPLLMISVFPLHFVALFSIFAC
jgi:hypothetical protein